LLKLLNYLGEWDKRRTRIPGQQSLQREKALHRVRDAEGSQAKKKIVEGTYPEF
jgi:hypothetical protein